MAHKNPKFVKKKGIKLSVDHYTEMALNQIQADVGMAPATILYNMAMNPHCPEASRMRERLKSIRQELIHKDNSSEFAA